MIIKEIELRDFRNYESLHLQFHNRVNIFLGENAQGKTNVLEALYLSSLGKSFRTTQDSDMIRFGSEYLKVRVDAEKEEEELSVEFVITAREKGIKIDGVKIRRMSELFEHIYAVIFSPEDLKIVKEDPEKRRRFIDTELCLTAPSYYGKLSEYRRILKQRNSFLKDYKMTGRRIDREELSVWNEKLAESGSAVMKKRAEFLEKLCRIGSGLHEKITDGREMLDIRYEPSVPYFSDFKEQREHFLEKLEESFLSDVRNASTGKGPHRDDMAITVNGIDLRKFGSQGQQRTAALSLKLSEVYLIREESGENAILLLDDVMSELDAARQSFLIHALDDVQLFITTTELSEEVTKALPSGYTFYVKKGEIERK